MNAENPVQIDLFGVSATRTKGTRLAEHIECLFASRGGWRRLRRRCISWLCRAWYGAVPPASRLLRIARGDGLTAGLDPGAPTAPGGRKSGQARACPAEARGTWSRGGAGVVLAGRCS
jgi:hypothetical protein